jgi:hypothetical protein
MTEMTDTWQSSWNPPGEASERTIRPLTVALIVALALAAGVVVVAGLMLWVVGG